MVSWHYHLVTVDGSVILLVCVWLQVIPLNNSMLIDKVTQTYRVQYIHDVILPTASVFDENQLSALTSFVYLNKKEIVNHLQVAVVWLFD